MKSVQQDIRDTGHDAAARGGASMMEDAIIRDTVDQLYPTAGTAARYNLKKILVELLADRRAGFDKPIDPKRAQMVRVFNRNYHRALRAEL